MLLSPWAVCFKTKNPRYPVLLFQSKSATLFHAHLRPVRNAAEAQAEKYLLNESECYYTHSHTARQNQYELCFEWEMLLLVPASQFLQFVPISGKWSMPFKAKYDTLYVEYF